MIKNKEISVLHDINATCVSNSFNAGGEKKGLGNVRGILVQCDDHVMA